MITQPPGPGALSELARDPSSRKSFLRMMGGGSAAAGLAGLLAACGSGGGDGTPTIESSGSGAGSSKASGGESGDVEIVNYALTLEHVEAAFYAQVADSGEIKERRAKEYVKAFGETERQHVVALTKTVKQLGGKPVGAPKTAFDLVIEGGEAMIIQIAATIENLGASAYLGQAPRIKSKEVLAAALSIHTVEARHAAALNELAGRTFHGGGSLMGTIPDGPFAKPRSMELVLKTAKPFLRS